MRLRKLLFASIGFVVFLPASAILGWSDRIPSKKPSDYGTNPTAAYWNLLAPTASITITSGAKSVTVTRQVICASYDVASVEYPSDTSKAGSCADGDYIFLFQLQSSSNNVILNISNLVGFTPTEANYGVTLCDNNDPITGNTLSLCTTATENQLPFMAFRYNASSHVAHFFIQNFPLFPAGVDQEGHGLTFYLRTQQASPIPVGFPTISIQ
jgi:hypothetical protein